MKPRWIAAVAVRRDFACRRAAALSYRSALTEAWVDGMLLARPASCPPSGPERDRVTTRLRARCGREADAPPSDAAWWVR